MLELTRALLCVAFVAAPTIASSASNDELKLSSPAIASARSAYGWTTDSQVPPNIRVHGTATVRDIELTYSLWSDRNGRYRSEFSGPVQLSSGYDGKLTWKVDPSGGVERLEGGGKEQDLLTNWILTGYWLAPEAPVEITPTANTAGARTRLDVKFAGGRFGGVAIVDPRTGWLKEFSMRSGGTHRVIKFSGHKKRRGVHIAHEITIYDDGNLFARLELPHVEFPPKLSATFFGPKDSDHKSAVFNAATPAALDVRARLDKRYVKVRVNDQDVGWFLFDTGASGSVISNQVATRLNAPVIGKVDSHGVGGAVEGTAVRLDSMSVGKMTLSDVVVVARPDLGGKWSRLGEPLAGILGNDLLRHCVVEYDHRRAKALLHNPSEYKLPRGTWAPMKIHNGQPMVELEYEDHRGLFNIDTGADVTVLFGPATVVKQKLLRNRKTRSSTISGSGGSVKSQSGKLRWIKFGGRRFDSVKAQFQTEDKGVMATELIDGLVGAGLLDKFTVIFDYPKRRIAFLARD